MASSSGSHLVINCRSGAAAYTDDPASAALELDEHADRVAAAMEVARQVQVAAEGDARDAVASLRAAAERGEPVDAALLLRLLGPVLG